MLPLNRFQRALELQPRSNSNSPRDARQLPRGGRAVIARRRGIRDVSGRRQPSRRQNRLLLAAGFAALKAGNSARALAAFRQAVAIEANRKSLEAAAETALQTGQGMDAAGYLERLAAAGDPDIDARARYLDDASVSSMS